MTGRMILLFPDRDTVRLALTSGLVPPDVTLAAAAVSTDAQGRLYVEPAVPLSRATSKVLDRLGVKGSKRHAADPRPVGSWVELVALEKEPAPEIAAGTPVMFELPTAAELPGFVAEMLRLGNDRQGFRWVAGDADDAPPRVLLRVLGPPYYTLLRATDRPETGVRAYLERAPRVWVEFGHSHPLAAQVKVADDQVALLTPPDRWRFLADAPFRDVYDLTRFPLPAAPEAWEAADAPEVVTVPLRLTAGDAADTAELWVLRDDPVARLDALVREADETVVQRLTFAVATAADGAPVAALRTRPSKQPPPILPLDGAAAYKPYWKLPNLYLPVGRRLHPTLRRDAVRRLLADDPDRVVWLFPDGAGGFTPESVPDAAFRPLEEWVDYVIETDHAALAAWVGATRFDFDQFVCTEARAPRPKADEPEPASTPKPTLAPAAAAKPDAVKPKARPRPKADDGGDAPPVPEAMAPNVARERARALEEQFLSVDGALDAPERVRLWPQLAAAYTAAGDAGADAAVCWLNALWDAPDQPAEWAEAWARAEFPHATGPVGAADLDAKLKAHTPSAADARAVVAAFLAASAANPPRDWLAARLPQVQKYLEANERILPVRAVWLAALRLARLAGGDPLGLARARDRLLKRLLAEGLGAERDLPGFLRVAGLRDADRVRSVRDKALTLQAAARAWVAHHPPTVPYVDLLFAFALARIGEKTAAKELTAAAHATLDQPIPADWPTQPLAEALVRAAVGKLLLAGFDYRIEQALADKPHAGPLPAALLAELNAGRTAARQPGAATVLKPASKAGRAATTATSAELTYGRVALIIDRMRQESKVLEPDEARDPYHSFRAESKTKIDQEMHALAAIREPARYVDRVRRLVREGFPGYGVEEVRFYVLHEALPTAPRIGEAFTTELVRLVPDILTRMPTKLPRRDMTEEINGRVVVPPGTEGADETPKKQGELVERALFAAAHFGHADLIRAVVAGFVALLRSRPEETRFRLINVVTGQCVRSLRRLGLRDELDQFIGVLRAEVLGGADTTRLRHKYAAQPNQWGAALQTLLNLAGGWLAFGMADRALPILDEARAELLTPGRTALAGKDQGDVIRTYFGALGHGPAELGMARASEILARFDPHLIPNNWTGSPTYSRFHLKVIEELVWALVSDEFALGPTGRKWLDDDEYLVRKRVHADVGRERERGGV